MVRLAHSHTYQLQELGPLHVVVVLAISPAAFATEVPACGNRAITRIDQGTAQISNSKSFNQLGGRDGITGVASFTSPASSAAKPPVVVVLSQVAASAAAEKGQNGMPGRSSGYRRPPPWWWWSE